MTRHPAVAEQMDAIREGAVEIVPEDELVAKVERSAKTRTPLIVKQGFDPTRPDLHIGHAVSIRKLRTFQELGHQVVFVVGDYTARVGDPSGRSETRPEVKAEEAAENARTYVEQVGRILDTSKVRVEFNSRWLAPLRLDQILGLTRTYTVARMLERDEFAKRMEEGRPISIFEFMYPLLQAYDSVVLRADVELGGTDQKFNLLMTRTVQERFGQPPQVCLLMPLLRGTDGELKMSKSYDNYVGIAQSPEEQFGRTMSIPDALLEEWITLAAGGSPADREAMLRQAHTDPYAGKRALARSIVAAYHGPEAAMEAEAHFDRVFRQREVPDEVPVTDVALTEAALKYSPSEGVWIAGLLVATGLAASNSEAIRLIEQGAVSADGAAVADRNERLVAAVGTEVLLRRGRRHFVRARFIDR